jgi:hypothetical protein
MEWENIPEDVSKWFGFVYVIERLNAEKGEKRFYWGCKQFIRNTKLPPLKGKTRKRKVIKESDWREYYGSSNDLVNDIQKYGKEVFKRTILKLCTCKWQLKFEELKTQMENNAIAREDSYNGIINVRLTKVPIGLKEHYNS